MKILLTTIAAVLLVGCVRANPEVDRALHDAINYGNIKI